MVAKVCFASPYTSAILTVLTQVHVYLYLADSLYDTPLAKLQVVTVACRSRSLA